MSILKAIGLVGLVASPAAAFWRLPCVSPIVVERADPIVNPGAIAGHVHTIMGGNAFDLTMGANQTAESTCSSCTVIGDNSNYWVPSLYYQAQDGSFESVDQVGGATVYYLQRKGDGETLKAFPPGFRMLAGTPSKRSGGSDFSSQAISYNCLDYAGGARPETGGFPGSNCPSGLRAQIFFPSCWNGKDLDSADHKSHVSYPVGAYNSGKCPPNFPVHLVSLFYEVIFDTNKFANKWYGSGQPFVWSMGDPTGYGFHGDFIMGWEGDILQRAVDQCTSDSGRVEDCPVFSLIPDNEAKGCRIASKIDETVTGKLAKLPGCNGVQAGPQAATKDVCSDAASISTTTASFFTDLTSSGWAYNGCGSDSIYGRTLTGASLVSADMTNEKCVAYCSSKGYSVAGTEYTKECYCGNSIPASAAPIPGVVGTCTMQCGGSSSELCGGTGAISLYTKCNGGACTNAQIGAGTSSNAASSNSGSSANAGSSSSVASTPSANPSATIGPTASASTVNSVSTSTASSSASASMNVGIPSGYTYQGCFVDTVQPRILSTYSNFNGNQMTNSACVSYCSGQGFKYAGTENSGECFCGNMLTASLVSDSECNMTCSGDGSKTCGGKARLSVFQKTAAAQSKRNSHARRMQAIESAQN